MFNNAENSINSKPVKELWGNVENKTLINRGFPRYAKELNEAGITNEDFLQILQRGKVLDVACGEGSFVADCLEKDIDVYGIDLGLARQLNIDRLQCDDKLSLDLKQRLVAGDATSLPFKNNTFKTVTNQAGAFSYAHNPLEMSNTLHEQIRVLSPGGKIIINPVELIKDGYFPVNYVNLFLDKGERFSEEQIDQINKAFSDEISKLIEDEQITIEVREKQNDIFIKRGETHGVAIITKIKY